MRPHRRGNWCGEFTPQLPQLLTFVQFLLHIEIRNYHFEGSGLIASHDEIVISSNIL